MKNTELVAKVLDVTKNHNTLYVMGCFGAPLTGGNVTRYCNNHTYNKDATRTAMIKAAADKTPPAFGFDCVNLIKGVLWGWTGKASATYGGAKYQSNGVPDISADQMINVCKNVSSSAWANMVPGEVVWTTGHIGVYIGDGLAVECTPRWSNNVQITAVANIGKKAGYNARTWKKHGKLPYVEYEAAEVPAAAAKTVYKVVAGDNLTKIAKAHGTTVQALAKANAIKNVNIIHVGDLLMLEASAAAAVDKLAALGVINSPDFWKAKAEKVKYLPELLIRSAQVIKKAKARTATPEKGVEALVKAGVIETPEYWLKAKDTVTNLPALLRALGGSV